MYASSLSITDKSASTVSATRHSAKSAATQIGTAKTGTKKASITKAGSTKRNGPPSPVAILPPPTQYGHFTLEADSNNAVVELGRGAMGITYLAMDDNLHISVAIKIIHPLLLARPEVAERFQREARAAARLRHQHIASVYFLGQEQGHWFYAMEYVAGETLQARINRGEKMSPTLVLDLARQIVEGLSAAEKLQIVHRDLKPLNLMVIPEENGRLSVKIIDFGLVKNLHAERDTSLTGNGMLGTPHYASPEQLRELELDQRSDFYSLGVTLWHLLVADTPCHGSRAEIIQQHLGNQLAWPQLDALPAPIVLFLRRLLVVNPDKRPADCTALLALLGETAMALERPVLTMRARRRSRMTALFVLLLLLLAAGVWAVWHFRPRLVPVTSVPLPSPGEPGPEIPADLSPYQLVERARSYYNKYETAQNEYAIVLLRRAIELDPKNAPAHVLLSNALCQRVVRFRFDRAGLQPAEEEARQAITLDDHLGEGHSALALVLQYRGRLTASLSEYARAVTLLPTDLHVMANLSIDLADLGHFDQSLAWERKVCALDPDNDAWIGDEADRYKTLNADALSEKTYLRCLEIQPQNIDARLGLAHLYMLQHHFDLARTQIDRAVAVAPEEAETIGLLAELDWVTDHLDAAEIGYRKLIQIDHTGNLVSYTGHRYLAVLAWLVQKRGDSAESRRLLDEAIDLDQREILAGSEFNNLETSLAASEMVRNQPDRALDHLQAYLDKNGSNWRSLELDPRFDPLRRDPRYQALIAKMKDRLAAQRTSAGLGK